MDQGAMAQLKTAPGIINEHQHQHLDTSTSSFLKDVQLSQGLVYSVLFKSNFEC